MTTQDDILSFMDILDLDEELIDQRLKTIMERDTFSEKHLANSLQLIKYKHLINVREDTDCENNEEFNFIVKLLANLQQDNIEYVCNITNIALCLDRQSLRSKTEHLLQQILTDLFDFSETHNEDEKYVIIMLKLKICSSVLDAAISNGQKVSLQFFETPLENLLDLGDEKLRNYFIINTVPRLFLGVLAYNILDRICNYLYNQTGECQFMALKIFSSLSEYFLPVPDKDGNMKYESDIIFQSKFWELILYGMNSVEAAYRKISIYLTKRSIDSIIARNCDIKIKSLIGVVIFDWESKSEKPLKFMWENFFILIESLEEKQSNIVLPSLQLFDNITEIGREWFNSALKIGLKHDNMQIKQTCILHSIKNHITCIQEAKMLLEALNDINLFHNYEGILINMEKLSKLCQDEDTFVRIFQTIPLVKWSPVPLYHVIFCLFEIKSLQSFSLDSDILVSIMSQVLKTPCNNVVIRKYVHIFVFIIFKTLCRKINCQALANICLTLQSETVKSNIAPSLIDSWISSVTLMDSHNLINLMSKPDSIHVMSQILKKTDSNSEYIIKINKKIENLQNVNSRQYCQKTEYLNDFIYLVNVYEHICNTDEMASLHRIMSKCLLQYILCLLLEDTISYTNDINTCINKCHHLLASNDHDIKDVILKLSSVCLRIFKDSKCDLERKVFSINVLKLLLKNKLIYNSQVTINDIIVATEQLDAKNDSQKRNHGRLLNNAYEKTCEIIYELIDIKLEEVQANVIKVLDFIDNVVECGGYGCLKWLLRIMNKILPILQHEKSKYDLEIFINRMWKEVEELKSNNQYAPCIKEFTTLITHEVLLRKPLYNNTIILYCKKIIDLGSVTVSPIWFLIENISVKIITSEMAQLVFVLQEILLFAPVIRNDQRILDYTINNILYNNHIDKSYPEREFHQAKQHEYPFVCMVQSLTVKTLLNIKESEIFQSIVASLMKRIDEVFKNKQRYHENSYHHRVLLLSLQHLLFLLFIQPHCVNLEETKNWSLSLLAKLPHQKSVKVYIEWYVSLIIYVKDIPLKAETVENERFRSIPLISKFVIMYLVLKQRILNNTYDIMEYQFVIEHLLSYTMVQTFNVRLHAQFLALKLYYMVKDQSQKYDYTLQLIRSNFDSNKDEKNYNNLNSDIFISHSNIICCLRPEYIYNLVPNLYDVFTRIDTFYLPKEEDCANYLRENNITSNIIAFCTSKSGIRPEININRPSIIEQHLQEKNKTSSVIQKKYIPWTNMSDVVGYEHDKKATPGDLVIVASLIDKLPNLGGLARTSEVFGVKTYVIDSLRHLQDKQFQGLSVSAERWVDIEEVRPGQPLKDYLLMMKSEGYSVVAAEQTSNSVPLQGFKFPKKTLLLLGHEKEGVPCDLLPLMDNCVEVPQHGFVRSLNVHVTAAIFIWQYYWQNML